MFIVFLGIGGLSKWQRTEFNYVQKGENERENNKNKYIYTIILPSYDKKNEKDHKFLGEEKPLI